MTNDTIKRLKQFVGHVCTIFTSPINRNFEESATRQYFVTQVTDVTVDGIWGQHPVYGDRSVGFFPLQSIILIQQELVIDPTNEKDQKIIADFEKQIEENPVHDDVFVSYESLVSLAFQTHMEDVKPKQTDMISVDSLTDLAKQVRDKHNQI